MTIPRRDPLGKRKPSQRQPARDVTAQKIRENSTDADSLKGNRISTNPPAVGHVLVFDGEKYVPQPMPSGGGGGGASPLTTKGDLWGYSTADARVPVGTDGQVLTADAASTPGVKWAAAASGHTIRENGTDQTSRLGLNFIDTDAGAGLITDDGVGNETEVNLTLYALLGGRAAGQTFSGPHGFAGALTFTGLSSPTWAARQDNVSTTGVSIFDVTLTGSQTLTGMTGVTGKLLFIRNIDTVDSLTISDNDANSSPSNRFALNGNIVLGPEEGAVFLYAGALWYCVGVYSKKLSYSEHQYIFHGTAAWGSALTSGVQKGYHHTGSGGETAVELIGHCDTADVGGTWTATIEIANGNDLDASPTWSTVTSVTMGTSKTVSSGAISVAMTADRILRLNITTLTGTAPQDISIILRVKRALVV